MTKTKTKLEQIHKPVLLNQVLSCLAPKNGESYLDLTGGYGGHAEAVLASTKAPKRAVLVDRDQEAADYLKTHFNDGETILHSDFYGASKQLHEAGKTFDLILADLGLSSLHLDKASRGFSFVRSGPLDMRMDARQSLTAEEVVNAWPKEQIAQVLRDFGEEIQAQRVAGAIVSARPIKTTDQLAEVVERALPYKRGKIHPATKVFQAIRIAVNDELSQLEQALPLWLDMLNPGGRIAVITFHSLEDRIVKQAFKDRAAGEFSAEIRLLTKSPLQANHNELVFNPRARSAKLRAAVKINNKEGAYSAYPGKK